MCVVIGPSLFSLTLFHPVVGTATPSFSAVDFHSFSSCSCEGITTCSAISGWGTHVPFLHFYLPTKYRFVQLSSPSSPRVSKVQLPDSKTVEEGEKEGGMGVLWLSTEWAFLGPPHLVDLFNQKVLFSSDYTPQIGAVILAQTENTLQLHASGRIS